MNMNDSTKSEQVDLRMKINQCNVDALGCECIALEVSGHKLRNNAMSCMLAVAECFELRRTVYLSQLRKIREVSNMATRKAVQVDNAQTQIYCPFIKLNLSDREKGPKQMRHWHI